MSLLSVEKLNEASHARQLGNELHRTYKNAWNTLKMEHEAGLDSLEVTAQLTRLMDEIVTYVYDRTAQDLVKEGMAGDVHCVGGLLNIGEAMSPPVIAAVKAAAPDVDFLVIDSPPGTSCPVIESVRDTDLVLLVTEPTPFGLNDLKLAVEMVRALKLPLAVVINRADVGDGQTRRYCEHQRIDVLAEIPDDRQVAEAYSRGELACDTIAGYRRDLEQLLSRIDALAAAHAHDRRSLP